MVRIDFGHRSVTLPVAELRDVADACRDNAPDARSRALRALGFKESNRASAADVAALIIDIADQTPGARRFECLSCGCQTHGAEGVIGPELCGPCYDLAGIDNACNDDGREPDAGELSQISSRMNAIEDNGGDAWRALESCEYLHAAYLASVWQ